MREGGGDGNRKASGDTTQQIYLAKRKIDRSYDVRTGNFFLEKRNESRT